MVSTCGDCTTQIHKLKVINAQWMIVLYWLYFSNFSTRNICVVITFGIRVNANYSILAYIVMLVGCLSLYYCCCFGSHIVRFTLLIGAFEITQNDSTLCGKCVFFSHLFKMYTYFVTPLIVSTGKNVSNSCAAGTTLPFLFVIFFLF